MKPATTQQHFLAHRCRPFALVLLASCSWADVTLGQTDATSSTPAGASGGKPAESAATTPSTVTPLAEPTVKPASSFRFGESTSAAGEGSRRSSRVSRPSSPSRASQPQSAMRFTPELASEEGTIGTFESGPIDRDPTAFVAPNLYGRAPQVLVPGQGVLARPRFRYGFAVGVGFDDNANQTPDNNPAVALVRPRVRSALTTVNGHWDVQWAKPRSVFTMAVDGGGVFYWDRPRDVADYNARLTLLYIYRIDPRTQFSANVNAAYLAQPDFSNVFASQTTVGGDYITGSSKFDLSHRWTRHFSTNTSFSANLLHYTQGGGGALANSFWDITFGNEFRFAASPRLTWVVEGRYGLQEYMDNSALNSDTIYFLGGFDWMWSRRLSTTLRAGGAIRSFDNGGDSVNPYVEVAATYLTGRRSSLNFNARYGYEQQNNAGDENLSYRVGLFYQRAITYRLSGTAGFNFVHTDFSPTVGLGTSTDVYDFNIGLRYRVDRHLTLGANYSFTQSNSSTGGQDFDRNRYVFSGEYEF
jgi:Putative beta-barrel porin 2